MNIESFREYCLSLKGATERFPFDETTLVFFVMNKMFALVDIEDFDDGVNLKCDPEHAIELRERYPCVIPGYHMNKKHWNTIKIDQSIPDSLIFEWTKDSYELIVKSLTKKLREELNEMEIAE